MFIFFNIPAPFTNTTDPNIFWMCFWFRYMSVQSVNICLDKETQSWHAQYEDSVACQPSIRTIYRTGDSSLRTESLHPKNGIPLIIIAIETNCKVRVSCWGEIRRKGTSKTATRQGLALDIWTHSNWDCVWAYTTSIDNNSILLLSDETKNGFGFFNTKRTI